MHEVDWTTLGSTIFGGGLSMMIARAYISKLLKTVDTLEDTVSKLGTTLAVLGVRAETVATLERGQKEHDIQLARLEALVYGTRNKGNVPSGS